MANALASIIVQTKDQATAEFEAIFARINAQYGNSINSAKKLQLTYAELAQYERKLAEAGMGIAGITGTQIKAYVDLSNAAGQNAEQYKKLETATTTTSQGFKVFGMNIVDVAAKFYLLQTGIRAVIDVIQQGFKLAELGAQIEQSDISFAHLLKTLGAAPDTMDRLREAAGGLATDYELQSKSAIVLTGTSGELGRQLANNLPQLLEISRAAKIVNPAIKDVDYAYESLTTGIKRGEKRWLDNIGIIFNATDAYKEYANAHNKSVAVLTEEEKQLAFLNKTLEVGEVIKKQAGGSLDSLTDRYGRLKVAIEGNKEAFGIFLDHALSPTVDKMTEAIGKTEKLAGIADELGDVWAKLTGVLDIGLKLSPTLMVFNLIKFALSQMLDATIELGDKLGWFGKQTEVATESTTHYDSALQNTYDQMVLSSRAVESYNLSTLNLNDAEEAHVKHLEDIGMLTPSVIESITRHHVETSILVDTVSQLNDVQTQFYEGLLRIGNETAALQYLKAVKVDLDAAAEAAKNAARAHADYLAAQRAGFDKRVQFLKGLQDLGQTNISEEAAKAVGLPRGGDIADLIQQLQGGANIFGLNQLFSELSQMAAFGPLVVNSDFYKLFLQRQKGGSVNSGQGYVVGENGPELFLPKQSGTIIPNNALGGGAMININAGAFLGSRADAVRLSNELLPLIARGLRAHGVPIQ